MWRLVWRWFDVSLQPPTSNAAAEREQPWLGGRYNKRPVTQVKESLRARRVQILPKGTVFQKIAVAKGVKASVTKEDPKQPLCGTLVLEKELKVDTNVQFKKRHPLVAQLLQSVSAGKYAGTMGCNGKIGKVGQRKEVDGVVMMNEVLGERDASYITAMVDSQAELDLEWRYVSEDDPRLCFFQRRDNKSPEVCGLKQQRSSANSLDSVFNEASEYGEKKTPPTNTKGKEIGADIANAVQTPQKKGKKPNTNVRSLKYKKNSFPTEDVASSLPLGVGDVVTCDIYQYRRTGAYVVENMKVLERKERTPAAAVVSDGGEDGTLTPAKKGKGLTGLVGEVFPNRQFGFIAPINEDSGKRGKDLFFHMSEVQVGSGGSAQGSSGPLSPSGRNKTQARSNAVGSIICKGDEVRFDIGKSGKNGKPTAANISILPRGSLKMAPTHHSKADLSKLCTGYILMEPSHTSFVNAPSHGIASQSGPTAGVGVAATGGSSRWDNVRDDAASNKNHKSGSNAKAEGVILLLSDPLGLFSPKPKAVEGPKKTNGEGIDAASENSTSTVVDVSSAAGKSNTAGGADPETKNAFKAAKNSGDVDSTKSAPVFVAGTHLHYKTSSVIRGFSCGASSRRNNDGPKRGDLVTFSKPRGIKMVKDIRIEKPNAATSVKGVLTDICKESDTAVFDVLSVKKIETRYNIRLTDVVSCDKALLKDKEQVDGILHEGQIFGVCRTKDIYLESSFSRTSGDTCGAAGGTKERPKLNLTVKKELQDMGGKIMAQSQMAKGPISGTNGFAPGWTTRVSPYFVKEEEEKEEEEKEEEEKVTILQSREAEEEEPPRSLSAAASEFVPNFSPIAPSGFE